MGLGCLRPRGSGSWVGSEGATDKCDKNFSCCGVMPGGLEVQGLGEGLPGVPTGMFGGLDPGPLDLLLALREEPPFLGDANWDGPGGQPASSGTDGAAW